MPRIPAYENGGWAKHRESRRIQRKVIDTVQRFMVISPESTRVVWAHCPEEIQSSDSEYFVLPLQDR